MVHFDSSKPLVHLCYCIGSVLAHIMEDGAENHIAYHSRSLSHAEKKLRTRRKEGCSADAVSTYAALGPKTGCTRIQDYP